MSYSSLKRRTPLRRKSVFKARQPLKRGVVGQLPERSGEKPPERARRGKRAAVPSGCDLVERLDRVFSLYIRLRDAMDGGMTRCVSCGRVFPFSRMQCGHYFTRHNMSVRWDEDNCCSQCVECNCHEHGNLDGYTPALLGRIGSERYEALCERARCARKWGDDELQKMIKDYAARVRKLSREKGIGVRI